MNIILKISKYFTMGIFIILLFNCTEPETQTKYIDSTPDYTKTHIYKNCLKDGINGVDGLDGALFVTVSPDNKNVYVTGRFDNSLTVFDRDDASGTLTYVKCFIDGVDGVNGLTEVRAVEVSPDNKNVYIAGRDDNSLAVFDRDTSTGALTYVKCFIDGIDGVDGLDGASGVAVSPDNKSVYVTGIDDNSLAVFDRNTTTGALTYSTCFINGSNGVDGLDYSYCVEISPDNKSVYVTGNSDDSLAVFNRNTTTGALTYVKCFTDGIDGVNGLDGASGVAVSPDNKSVYVTGNIDDSLAVFNRNTSTGDLTYMTCFTDGINGVDELDQAISVAVSFDNKSVYVASYNDDSLTIFDRNTTTGALTYGTCFIDGTDGVDGLSGIRDVSVSSDNKNIYIAGRNDDSVAVFFSFKDYE